MGPPLQTSELKHGGLISGEAEWVGGQTFFKDMVSAGLLDIGNVMQMEHYGFVLRQPSKMNLTK